MNEIAEPCGARPCAAADRHFARAGLLGEVRWTADDYGACEGADALVIATERVQYRSPNIARLARSMKRRFVFDGCNVLSADGFKAAGFAYRGMGRRRPSPPGVSRPGLPFIEGRTSAAQHRGQPRDASRLAPRGSRRGVRALPASSA